MAKIADRTPFTRNTVSRNRVVMPPMDTLMSTDGYATDFHVQHYGARAFGGVGVIIVESTAISSEGRIRAPDLGIWKDAHVAVLSRVAKIIKDGGAVAGIQLGHAGAKSEVIELKRYGATKYYDYIDQKKLKIVDKADLDALLKKYVAAAKRAKRAGFQFVEVHAAHGYLLSEFISPLLNQVSNDPDIVKRSKYVIDVCKAIRNEVPGIDVTIRFSVEDYEVGGNTPKDFAPLVKALEPYVDAFHISSGETVNRRGFDPKGDKLFRLALGQAFRGNTKKPIIVGANVSTPHDVHRIINEGQADFVGIGRALINNPNLVINTLLPIADVTDANYPWNNNVWFSNEKYNQLMDKLGERAKAEQ